MPRAKGTPKPDPSGSTSASSSSNPTRSGNPGNSSGPSGGNTGPSSSSSNPRGSSGSSGSGARPSSSSGNLRSSSGLSGSAGQDATSRRPDTPITGRPAKRQAVAGTSSSPEPEMTKEEKAEIEMAPVPTGNEAKMLRKKVGADNYDGLSEDLKKILRRAVANQEVFKVPFPVPRGFSEQDRRIWSKIPDNIYTTFGTVAAYSDAVKQMEPPPPQVGELRGVLLQYDAGFRVGRGKGVEVDRMPGWNEAWLNLAIHLQEFVVFASKWNEANSARPTPPRVAGGLVRREVSAARS